MSVNKKVTVPVGALTAKACHGGREGYSVSPRHGPPPAPTRPTGTAGSGTRLAPPGRDGPVRDHAGWVLPSGPAATSWLVRAVVPKPVCVKG